MTKLDVRVVKLPPMRVASFIGFGESPEMLASQKLNDWANPKGYMVDTKNHRVFGFNNPNPSPVSPNYGYEFWMQVSAEFEAKDDVLIKQFKGGLYAVARCEIPKGGSYDVIGATWNKLVTWREASPYKPANHQWLEEHVEGKSEKFEFILDLFMPIAP